MRVPRAIIQAVEEHIGTTVTTTVAVGGGCIANAVRISTADRDFFLKWGGTDVARTFPSEAEGLKALRQAASPVVVPEVFLVQSARNDSPGFLLMAWIEQSAAPLQFWNRFGSGLAQMHRHTSTRYGFPSANFIGRLPQRNEWHDSWSDFFRSRRLDPQVRMAREAGRWESRWNIPLQQLYNRLPDLLPAQPPASILHGDLWSGNYMVTSGGNAALIDPAAYFGHREADLAMTELFGGFDAGFYTAYNDTWPLEPGYDLRKEIYNLYHLINHLNHFGASYAGGVARVLSRFR